VNQREVAVFLLSSLPGAVRPAECESLLLPLCSGLFLVCSRAVSVCFYVLWCGFGVFLLSGPPGAVGPAECESLCISVIVNQCGSV
jgi:hypothetical protein